MIIEKILRQDSPWLGFNIFKFIKTKTMKLFKMTFTVLLFSLTIFLVSSCDNGGTTDKVTTEQGEGEKALGPEYTSAYICPMHCEGSGSDQPGKCPVCGMDYKKNEDQ